MEQELEVFLPLSCGFVLLGGDPEIELLCIQCRGASAS